jgi:hypothetical protein
MKYSAEYSNAHNLWWIEDENGRFVCDFYSQGEISYWRFDNAEENCKKIVGLLNLENEGITISRVGEKENA